MKSRRFKLTGWENGQITTIWEFNLRRTKDGKFTQAIQMKMIEISSQKVIAILKRDLVNDRDCPLQKEMLKQIFKMLKYDGREILLKSGAKLIKDNNNYFISGYAEDNRDVDCYF